MADRYGNPDLTKMLLDKTGLKPLHLGTRFGLVDLAKILLDKGANIETANKGLAGRSLLTKMVEMLSDNQARKRGYLGTNENIGSF